MWQYVMFRIKSHMSLCVHDICTSASTLLFRLGLLLSLELMPRTGAQKHSINTAAKSRWRGYGKIAMAYQEWAMITISTAANHQRIDFL